jgi:RNA polymerase sigma-70 factor (ECF subfamily)
LAFVRRTASEGLLSRVEAEDLLQEAVAGAVRGLGDVAGEDLDPLAWLFGLLRRRIIDAHRHHFASGRRDAARQRSLDAALSPSGEGGGLADLLVASLTTPSAALSRDLKVMRVRQAIDGLDEELRDIVRWRYIEGLPTKEIAERLGKSDAAVRVTLSRTLRKLEQWLGSR